MSVLEKYPLGIENLEIKGNKLYFRVINNTKGKCDIYLNNELIETTNCSQKDIVKDLTNTYIGKFNVRVENDNKFIIKSIDNDLSNYFNHLERTLKGKEGYFFLVNDRNNEIRVHYDRSFEHNLDLDKFRESTLSKKTYLENNNINYALFVVPDKSITLQDKLPFETGPAFRYVDFLNDILYDLNDLITEEDRLKTDTHISHLSSLKVVSYISSILSDENYDNIYNKLKSAVNIVERPFKGDLFNDKNWSYERDEMFHTNKTVNVKKVQLKYHYEKVELTSIPEEFRHISRRDSYYYRNNNSISDKRAVILHDSTALFLINAFVAYYKEVFFYWDHWFFNNKLIEWFNPDDVVEIRTERFIDSPQYPIVHDNYFTNFPVSAQLTNFNVDKNRLNAKLLIKDYRSLAVNANIKTYLNDKLISNENSNRKIYNFSYPLTEYDNGKYNLRFEVKTRYKYREVIKDFVLEDSFDSMFKNLKYTLKGVDNTFFIVNDNNNELKQHYDKMFTTSFNEKRFINTLISKKNYLEKLSVNYNTFIIPDKSVVLSDNLPFNHQKAYRHVDFLNDYVYDLMCVVDKDDYLLNDTNISMCAGIKIVSYILSVIDDEKSFNDYTEIINDNVSIKVGKHRGNLFTNRSWSYPEDKLLHDKYYEIEVKKVVLDNITSVDENSIPSEFRKFSTIASNYFKNDNSLTNKKALILYDDSMKSLIPSLLVYYREVFFYHDLWYFNKQLVEWFKPDDVIEIRFEKTLENTQYQLVSIEEDFVIPVLRKIKIFEVKDNTLNIKILYEDLKHVNVNTNCNIFIDNKLINTVAIDGLLNFSFDIDNKKHLIEVVLDATGTTKRNVYKQFVGGKK